MLRIDMYVCRIHKQFKTIIVDILLWSLPFLQWERDKSWVPLMSNLKSKGHAHTLCTNSQAILLPWRKKEEWIKRSNKEEHRVRTVPQKINPRRVRSGPRNKQEIWNSRISLLIPIASMFCLKEKLFMYTSNDNKEHGHWNQRPGFESHIYHRSVSWHW